MAALDFPDTPTVGQLYGSQGTVWRWDGTRWASTAGASGARGVVAYAQITVHQAGIVGLTDIAGLSVTWTADPSRVYRVSAHGEVYSAGNNEIPLTLIANGAGAQLARHTDLLGGAGYSVAVDPVVIERGLSGVQTRKVQLTLGIGAGPLTFYAAVNIPAYILVEDITYEAGTAAAPLDTVTADARYVNAAGDTMTGNLNLAPGVKLDFTDEVGTKLDLYGGTYTLGIKNSTLAYETGPGSIHEFNVGGARAAYIDGVAGVVSKGLFVQSGTYVGAAVYSNVYEIYYPIAFSAPPIVMLINGDNAALGNLNLNILSRFAERVTLAVYNGSTAWVSGTIRIDWIAHGPR